MLLRDEHQRVRKAATSTLVEMEEPAIKPAHYCFAG
jgi:hypothetical protein